MNMEIQLLLFGQLIDIAGISALEISDVNNTDELTLKLGKRFLKMSEVKYAIAVNKVIIQENTPLNDKDIVALLPPFSGG
jgi:molybdopterin synthase sulfur carrier subunit